jgi:Protein of unknown function (DUF2283)
MLKELMMLRSINDIPPKNTEQPIKITYDREVDIVQITLKEGAIAESGEETPGSQSAIAL